MVSKYWEDQNRIAISGQGTSKRRGKIGDGHLFHQFLWNLVTVTNFQRGKEDLRLKRAFRRLWEKGTDYVGPETFQNYLTSGELKVKPKTNNIAGLQIADIIAHPSRNEILCDNWFSEVSISPFARKIIAILQSKYYRREGSIYGKKFL
jgi:hypothetical protein